MFRKLKQYIPYQYQFILTHLHKMLLPGGFVRKTYSADGEDLLLEKQLFGKQKKGFYVDVGSLHPKYVSNTYKLYRRGWNGINIDPNPTTQRLFEWYRPRDTNLCLGISQEPGQKTYYEFEFQGLNTLDDAQAQFRIKERGDVLQAKTPVPCLPLREIFKTHLPAQQSIDLLDVDVEGYDLEVLKSNDWDAFRPKIILVEDREFRTALESSEIYVYLHNKNYTFVAYHNITLIMQDKASNS